MPYESATPCGFSKSEIFQIGDDIAGIFDLEPGDDLEPLVSDLGGQIHHVDPVLLNQTNDGSIRIDSEDQFYIFLANDVGPARTRFTIAHELGHYFLHLPLTADGMLVASRYGTGKVEWEANWFAAALLMPSGSFLAELDNAEGNISDVANLFGVSVQSAAIRASELTAAG